MALPANVKKNLAIMNSIDGKYSDYSTIMNSRPRNSRYCF